MDSDVVGKATTQSTDRKHSDGLVEDQSEASSEELAESEQVISHAVTDANLAKQLKMHNNANLDQNMLHTMSEFESLE